ncbi:MAG TPA: type II CAAX endopeptidase family protein [bacterium]|nr:type II CAAX endopeptidase family protein [bacterium]
MKQTSPPSAPADHRYYPLRFYLPANAVMWAAVLTAAYVSYLPGGGSGRLISALVITGLFTPFAAALWMIYTSRSPELKRDFYDKLFNLKLIRPWTIPAIFLVVPAAMVLSVVLSHLFFGQPLSQLTMAASPFAAGIVPAQALLLLAPVIEEIGWRGYGVDSLRGGRSYFSATLIFAALWAFWHGPTFFVRDYYMNMLVRTNPLFALNFVVSFFPATIIFNWLWYKNRGSILTAILCHAVIDFQGMLQMGQIAKCIETAVMGVIAMLIVLLNRKMFFGKFPARIGCYEA